MSQRFLSLINLFICTSLLALSTHSVAKSRLSDLTYRHSKSKPQSFTNNKILKEPKINLSGKWQGQCDGTKWQFELTQHQDAITLDGETFPLDKIIDENVTEDGRKITNHAILKWNDNQTKLIWAAVHIEYWNGMLSLIARQTMTINHNDQLILDFKSHGFQDGEKFESVESYHCQFNRAG